MKIIKKILEAIKEPRKVIIYFASLGIIKYDDKKYLEYMYRKKMGKDLNLENPIEFNEKLQWLKLYDRNPLYTKLVDKYEVKNYITNTLSEEYVIPLLGVYDKINQINFDNFPDKFVLKTTHDSGTIVICTNKEKFNKKAALKKLKKRLKRKYYYLWREWPYKNIKPKIIVEPFIIDKNGQLNDYKFFCFNGKSDYVMVCIDRDIGKTKFYYYDRNWQLQKEMSEDASKVSDNFNLPKPNNLNEMFEIAEKLSKGFPFVRIDLYNVDGKIYFGEFTFYPSAGFDKDRANQCSKIFSQKLKIYKE